MLRALVRTASIEYAICQMVYNPEGGPVSYDLLEASAGFRTIAGLETPAANSATLLAYAKVVEAGEAAHFRHYCQVLDRHYDVSALRYGPGQFICSYTDVTSFVRVEAELRASYAEVREANDCAAQALTAVRANRSLVAALAAARGVAEASGLVLEAALSLPGVDGGGVYVVDPDTGDVDLVSHSGLSPEFVRTVEHFPRDSEPAKLVAKATTLYARCSEVQAAMALPADLLSFASLPVVHNERTVAVVNLASRTVAVFPAETRLALESLAGHIAGSLARIRAESAISESEQRLRQAQAISHAGSWEINLATKVMWGSEEAFRVYGVDRLTPSMPLKVAQDCVLPQYRPALDEALLALIAGRGCYDVEFEIARANDGAVRFVHSRAELLMDPSGRPARVRGVFQDITERKMAEVALRERDARQSAMIANISDVICIVSCDGVLAYHSPNLTRWFGWLPEELNGTDGWDTVHPDDREWLFRAFEAVIAAGPQASDTAEYRYRCKDGTYRWIELTGVNMLHEPAIGGVLMNFHDVTEKRTAREQAQAQQERLSLALEASGDAIWETNHVTGELHASARYYEMLGYEPSDFTTRAEWLALLHPDDVPTLETVQRLTRDTDKYHAEARRRAKDGTWRWVLTRGKILERAADGSPVRVLGVSTDTTERHLKEEQLRFLSSHDKLTGLFNRRYLEDSIRSSEGSAQLPTTFIMGDVNGLKLTNDTFGHASGDHLLTLAARLLSEVVGDAGTIARWGGDEFLVVLPGVGPDAGASVVERMRAACAGSPMDPFPLSVALGQATRESLEHPIENVLREAEERMYHSKLTEGKSTRSAIIAALRETLSAKTFETDEHCFRMQTMASLVAKRMGIPDGQRDDLLLLALLHDIGKIGVPEAILTKPARLNPEERGAIEKHAEIGYRIAKASYELTHVADGILSHHEWWDGGGYPQGLSGEGIPLVSRVISVIDAHDAMTSDRPYRSALTQEAASAELRRCSGTQFDPAVVDAVLAAAVEMSGLVTEQSNMEAVTFGGKLSG